MYIALTGSENNKDVYIYHSFRKENGKSSSRIYKKLGKYNTLLQTSTYKNGKFDIKKAGFIRPARYFSNIQLSNSREIPA